MRLDAMFVIYVYLILLRLTHFIFDCPFGFKHFDEEIDSGPLYFGCTDVLQWWLSSDDK